MKRRSFALGVLSTVAVQPAKVYAYRKPEGPPTLSSAYIVFHVKDDDKDDNSYETIVVTAGEYQVGSLQSAGAGQRWQDQNDTSRLYLQDVDRNLEPSDCGQIKVDINHATKGNDNFKFTFSVTLTFSDGRAFNYHETEKITLTKDSGHGNWSLRKAA